MAIGLFETEVGLPYRNPRYTSNGKHDPLHVVTSQNIRLKIQLDEHVIRKGKTKWDKH